MAGPATERLTAIYAAFNARDIDTILAHLAPDVDWPNAWEGGRLHGPEAVREYWTRQWAAIDPSVEPVGFEERPDGAIAVDVHQVVKDLDGAIVNEGRVTHTYAFSGDGLVTRMDVT
jgi:ketosteroid isomerase-like protein